MTKGRAFHDVTKISGTVQKNRTLPEMEKDEISQFNSTLFPYLLAMTLSIMRA